MQGVVAILPRNALDGTWQPRRYSAVRGCSDGRFIAMAATVNVAQVHRVVILPRDIAAGRGRRLAEQNVRVLWCLSRLEPALLQRQAEFVRRRATAQLQCPGTQ